MFKCRICSGVPFAALFGFGESPTEGLSGDENRMCNDDNSYSRVCL